MILVSACLLGYNCKYNGGNNKNPQIIELLKGKEIIPVCPEELGGLTTPRTACEIIDGTGKDVLEGNCRVLNKEGFDLTPNFIEGAKKTLAKAQEAGCELAILKSRSPSCGVNYIYDGSFSSKLRSGDGVTTALLKQHGIKVVNEEDYLKGELANESD